MDYIPPPPPFEGIDSDDEAFQPTPEFHQKKIMPTTTTRTFSPPRKSVSYLDTTMRTDTLSRAGEMEIELSSSKLPKQRLLTPTKKKDEKNFIKDNIVRSRTKRSKGALMVNNVAKINNNDNNDDPNTNINQNFYNNTKNFSPSIRDRSTSYFHQINENTFNHNNNVLRDNPNKINLSMDSRMNMSDLDDSFSRQRRMKKKPLYKWETAGSTKKKESDLERQVRLAEKENKTTTGQEGNYFPDEQFDGFYRIPGAEPPKKFVDFRIVISDADFEDFQKRKKFKVSGRRTGWRGKIIADIAIINSSL